jgi:opacity protein-like surface antigen
VKRAFAAAILAIALAAPAAAAAGSPPNDPLAQRQWYLARDRALDVFDAANQLLAIRVAVIDSGIDLGHSELKGRVVAKRSFVGGTVADTDGHGTFVAGEIAALADNGAGIAGLAPSARLVVAKVVRDDGTAPPRAEARAIRWAVRSGARVINVSLGSTRDPADSSVDGFSASERRAVEFAVRSGVLVVAAAGNGNDAPQTPWPYASYPSAFPHVLGVAAYGRSGAVPGFSNRDDVYIDLAAPGMDIFSLLPRAVTAKFPSCPEQGYSSCGPKEYRHADGTSFSSPQVAAAAAVLIGAAPALRPDQVGALLKVAAEDATPANGCNDCTPGPDPLTGFGRLDVAAAMQALRARVPTPDRFEPNDDAGRRAAIVYRPLDVRATLDWWDDPNDVYAVHLRRGQRMSALVRAGAKVDASIVLWKPGLHALADARSDLRAKRSIHGPGVPERIVFRARRSGWYSLQVKLARPPAGPYPASYRIRLAF